MTGDLTLHTERTVRNLVVIRVTVYCKLYILRGFGIWRGRGLIVEVDDGAQNLQNQLQRQVGSAISV